MIYVECNPDLALVKSITKLPNRDYAHERGRNAICKRLSNNPNCLGLVDEDPSSVHERPAYMKQAKLKEDMPDFGLKLFSHESDNNYIIALCPRLEEWSLAAARETGVDVKKYGLPDNAKRLHEVINLDSRKFEKLLVDLAKSTRLRKLQNIIKTIKQ